MPESSWGPIRKYFAKNAEYDEEKGMCFTFNMTYNSIFFLSPLKSMPVSLSNHYHQCDHIMKIWNLFNSWLWFTRRQVSESIIRFPWLKPLAGPGRPFVKSQLLSTIKVRDPSLFRGNGNPKSCFRHERSFGLAAVGVMGIVSGRPV